MNVKAYIKAVEKYLEKTHGEIKPEWESTIKLLEDNLELYESIKKAIAKEGVYNHTTGKRNPLLSSMKDVQGSILAINRHLGLSPFSASKIKHNTKDDTDDFLDNLTS